MYRSIQAPITTVPALASLTTILVLASGCIAPGELATDAGGVGPDAASDDDGDLGGENEETEPIGWDATPPAATDGSTMEIMIQCGLNEGPMYVDLVKAGDRWTLTDVSGAMMRPEVEPCMPPDDTAETPYFLIWDAEPSMYLYTSALHHDLVPTPSEDRWIGDVTPIDESSDGCVESLSSVGLAWPVRMTLDVTGLSLR